MNLKLFLNSSSSLLMLVLFSNSEVLGSSQCVNLLLETSTSYSSDNEQIFNKAISDSVDSDQVFNVSNVFVNNSSEADESEDFDEDEDDVTNSWPVYNAEENHCPGLKDSFIHQPHVGAGNRNHYQTNVLPKHFYNIIFQVPWGIENRAWFTVPPEVSVRPSEINGQCSMLQN